MGVMKTAAPPRQELADPKTILCNLKNSVVIFVRSSR